MKTRFSSEANEWTVDGAKITSPENLQIIRKVLKETPIIVEHRFYRSAKAPDRIVFHDYENFIEYLNTKTRSGDSIWIWNYSSSCNDENKIVQGKCPDNQDRVPKKGAY